MKTVMIKINELGICTLGHPLAHPLMGGAYLVQVTDCPRDIPLATVLRQYARVIVTPTGSRFIPWSAIEDQPQGALVRLTNEGAAP